MDTLRDTGFVSATTGFPGSRGLEYRVESSPACVNVTALFSDNTMRVRLPESVVLAWATTEQVSMAGEQTLDDGNRLTILVEKDFTCLAPREGEDESDMFPHPQAGSASC